MQVANSGVLGGGVNVVKMKLAVEVARVDDIYHQCERQEPLLTCLESGAICV
jgi:hypothetical protein